MNKIAVAGILGVALSGAGCVEPARQRVIVASPEPVRVQASVKRISSDGAGGLVLPDGTRVALDARGGFALPNGAYVRRDASGALNLPNGSRCVPDMDGFACP